MSLTGWIGEAKTRPLVDVVAALALEMRRHRYMCPACNNTLKDGRGSLVIMRSGMWFCSHKNSCQVRGDVVDLVAWKLTGKSCKDLDPAGRSLVREWFGVAHPAGPTSQQSPAPADPGYPPMTAVQSFWDGLTALDLAAPGPREWLESRRIDWRNVAALDLVRVATDTDRQHLPGCPGWPWVAVMPLVDVTGLVRSFRFRAIVPPEAGPKSRSLTGFGCAGLVLADPLAMAMLALRPGCDVTWGGMPWSGVVHIVEGEPDYLTLASHQSRAIRGAAGYSSYAVIGCVGSGGLPENIAARIPDGAEVHVWPHQDDAGERAADLTIDRLPMNITVKKRRL